MMDASWRRCAGAVEAHSTNRGPFETGGLNALPPGALQVSLSKPAGFKAGKAAAARAPVARVVSCSAQKKEASKQVATGVAAAAMALTFGFGAVDAAYADVAGLTPCSESKAFAKRKKNEVGSLWQKRCQRRRRFEVLVCSLACRRVKACWRCRSVLHRSILDCSR